MGKLTFLTNQFNAILEGNPNDLACGFRIPNLESVEEKIGEKEFIKLRCEVWRPREITFDPQNYSKTFKAPIDLLSSNGFIKDDSWKSVDEISYTGGGGSVWKRKAVRYEGDGLPDKLTPQWWMEQTGDYNDILIRVLVEK